MLVRGASLAESLSQYLVERIARVSNTKVLFDVEVTEFLGADRLEGVVIGQRSRETRTDLTTSAIGEGAMAFSLVHRYLDAISV